MTSIPMQRSRALPSNRARVRQSDRFYFGLLLFWLVLEFIRPAGLASLSLAISVVALLGWLFRQDKSWTAQNWGFLALAGLIGSGVLYAVNTFSVFQQFRLLASLFVCICFPLQSLLVSVERIRTWAYTFVGVAFVIGVWAATHHGYGPAGASGAQDENYVAAIVGMAIPFAYFALFTEKRKAVKTFLISSLVVFLAAIAFARDVSRGGFIGLCAVTLYCLLQSPKKLKGIGVLGVLTGVLLLLAGPKFWATIATTADYKSGTADVRIAIWKLGLRMWQYNPLFGVGAGNFRWRLGDYQTVEATEKFGHNLSGSIVAHSFPVEVVAELGALGLLIITWLIVRTWKDLRAPIEAGRANPAQQELSGYSHAIRASIVAVVVNGIFLSLTYFSNLWLLIAVGAAIGLQYRRQMLAGNSGPPSASSPTQEPVPVGRAGWRTTRSLQRAARDNRG